MDAQTHGWRTAAGELAMSEAGGGSGEQGGREVEGDLGGQRPVYGRVTASGARERQGSPANTLTSTLRTATPPGGVGRATSREASAWTGLNAFSCRAASAGGRSFVNEQWLRSQANGRVMRQTAMAYFRLSPFYEDYKVRNHKVEYRVHGTGYQELFVVVKQIRYSPTLVSKLGVYYILDNEIREVPTLGDLVVSRLSSACSRLLQAFNKLQSARPVPLCDSSRTQKRRASDIAPTSNKQTSRLEGSQEHELGQRAQSVSEASLTASAATLCSAKKSQRRRLMDQSAERQINGILRSLVNEYILDEPSDRPRGFASSERALEHKPLEDLTHRTPAVTVASDAAPRTITPKTM